MGRRDAAQAIYSEEVAEMHMEERVGRLEVSVANIQSDVAEMKTDIRALRAEVGSQGKELRAEISNIRTELKAEISALTIAFEKFKGRQWVAFAVVIILQMLSIGGFPAALARAFKWP